MKLPQDRPEIVVYFLLASLFLWIGLGMWFLGEGGYTPSHTELITTLAVSLAFVVPAVLLTLRIAWLWNRG